MKKITLNLQSFLAVLFALAIWNTNAQVDATNETTAGSCDGTAILTNSNLWTSWNWMDSTGTLIQAGGDTLTNLCAGAYMVEDVDSIGTNYYTFIVGTDTPCAGFSVSVSTYNETAVGSCDGSATVSINGGTPAYTCTWDYGGTATIGTSIDSLCAGMCIVWVQDANGCSATDTVYVLTDSSTTVDLSIDVLTVDDSGLCDGSATLNVNGGTTPYAYYFSNGGTTATTTGLCAGIYSVVVFDAQGDSLFYTFLISDPASTINNNNYSDSTIVDTTTIDLIEDCNIDFNTIDTAWLDSFSYLSSDSISVTWAITDSSGTNFITVVYGISTANGVFTFELSVYCPNKAVEQFLKVYEQLYINYAAASANLDEQLLGSLHMYPNPTNGKLNLSFDEAKENIDVFIYTLEGKVVGSYSFDFLKETSIEIPGENGIYLLVVNTSNQRETFRIVKH